MHRRPGWLLFSAGLVLALAGCPNDTKDAHCAPDAPSRDLDPACIYAGNGNGPRVSEPACVVPGDAPPDADCPTFTDVFDTMKDPAKGNCTSSNCHGAAREGGIFLDETNPMSVYETLTQITGTVGTPYVVPGEDGWMYCNVAALEGGGDPQPPPGGLASSEDVEQVRQWIKCGANGPE